MATTELIILAMAIGITLFTAFFILKQTDEKKKDNY